MQADIIMQGKIEPSSDYSLLDILFWLFKPQIMAKTVDNDHTNNLVVKFNKFLFFTTLGR